MIEEILNTHNRKIFIISDTHFFHGNIIKYCNRPFNNYEEMNDELVKRWNSVVGENDVVLHLGDFAFKGKAKLIRPKLNGIIILIRGNHDQNLANDDGFLIVEGKLIFKNYILTHYPMNKDDIPEGYINIHGHIHHNKSHYGVNVSAEQINYTPQLFSSVINNLTVNKV